MAEAPQGAKQAFLMAETPQIAKQTVFIEDASGGAQPPPSLGRFRFREVLAR